MRSLRYQRGFLYLTTGGNGTGKTLFTLQDVRKLQLETGRDVYFWGFDAKQPLLDFGWRPFEPDRWQDLPDGSICIVDECQKVMPVRGTGQPPPWIGAIAEVHRKRGFDFFLITQHPLNFDAFVRRLISSPGWHRHFKASSMSDSSNELKWASVKDNPQAANSSASGEVTPRSFPKEVYGWYESATKHTARKRIPLKVWGALAGAIAAVAMVVFAVLHFLGNNSAMSKAPAKPAAEQPSTIMAALTPAATPGARSDRGPLTTTAYLEQRTPRLPDFPHTAPAYDGITAPTEAPYPAACVQMGKRCDCYTQQATPLRVAHDVCVQIVARGYFMDWRKPEQSREPPPQQVAQAPIQTVRTVPMPGEVAAAPQAPASEWSQALAARNAQVRSSLGR